MMLFAVIVATLNLIEYISSFIKHALPVFCERKPFFLPVSDFERREV